MAIRTSGRVSDAEVTRRTGAVTSVRHSTALEGGRSTEAARALQDAYAAGEITLEELGERTKALHGLA
ncbi:antitoxin VbhA family protein [Kribbella sp. NPDC050820]|uniref:antitoxin VbhA family protein n=1 Tax=Kribbella sp. NPDC050820 TaxID=3155408 RepID=UPI0033FB8C01